jgi:conjugal transfer/entry exclusion protein
MSEEITREQWARIVKSLSKALPLLEEAEEYEDKHGSMTPSMQRQYDKLSEELVPLFDYIEEHEDDISNASSSDRKIIDRFLYLFDV